MGCIRVDKITEYLCEPLRKCLKDEDPYVRKTAAVCVAKLYDISSGTFFIIVFLFLIHIQPCLKITDYLHSIVKIPRLYTWLIITCYENCALNSTNTLVLELLWIGLF